MQPLSTHAQCEVDCLIIGAWWGENGCRGVLSEYLVALAQRPRAGSQHPSSWASFAKVSEAPACAISWLLVPQLPNFRVCRWGLGSRTTSGPSSTTASWATALKPDRPATSECCHQPGLQEPQRSGPSSSLIHLQLSHRLAALKGRLPNRHAGLCATQCPSRTCGFATRSSRWCWRCTPTCASLPAVRTPQSTACASRDSSASGLATYCGAALPRSVGLRQALNDAGLPCWAAGTTRTR